MRTALRLAMARLFQPKLQAPHGPRLLSAPSLLCARQLACRWYGGSALLEDLYCSSQCANDVDGRSVAALQEEQKIVNKTEGFKEETTKDKSNDSFQSLMEKLGSSVLEKSKKKVNLTADQRTEAQVSAKASIRTNESSKKEDTWQQVRSTFHNTSLKNASKGPTTDKSGLSIAGDTENRVEPGMTQSPSPSALEDSLLSSAFGKNFKQQNAQPQSSNQQKTKEAKPESFSFLKALVDSGTHTGPENDFPCSEKAHNNISQYCNQRNGEASQGRLTRSPDNGIPLRSGAVNGSSRADMQGFYGSSRADMQGRLTSSNEQTPRSSTGYMVCVHNLPVNSNPAMFKASMATHGEVAGIFKRSSRDDFLSVYVQFKTIEGMEAALATRRLHIDSRSYYITRAEVPLTTVVRLSKVNQETAESQLQSVCERYGGLDNIRKRGYGIYDIYYKVRELPNMSSILGSLNEVTVNRSAWVAMPAPVLHPAVRKDALKSREGQVWHETQTNLALGRIESGLESVSVLFEDMKELVALGKECSSC